MTTPFLSCDLQLGAIAKSHRRTPIDFDGHSPKHFSSNWNDCSSLFVTFCISKETTNFHATPMFSTPFLKVKSHPETGWGVWEHDQNIWKKHLDKETYYNNVSPSEWLNKVTKRVQTSTWQRCYRDRGSDALSVEDIDNETHLNYYENRNTKLAYNRLA